MLVKPGGTFLRAIASMWYSLPIMLSASLAQRIHDYFRKGA